MSAPGRPKREYRSAKHEGSPVSRRDFLQRSAALGAAGFAANLDLLSLTAHAATTDYKALVCVFLYGGVDGNNVLVPLDATGYGQYAAAVSYTHLTLPTIYSV